jgi:hypothetical protein
MDIQVQEYKGTGDTLEQDDTMEDLAQMTITPTP